MDSKICLVPVFGPALLHNDCVIEYIKRVVNNKAIKNSFVVMFDVISNPAILTDEDMWKVLLEIFQDFDYYDEDASCENSMWRFFKRVDDVLLQKLTGFMLRQFGSVIMTRMRRSSGLPTFMVVPS